MEKKAKSDPAEKLEARYGTHVTKTAMKLLPSNIKHTICYIARYFSGI